MATSDQDYINKMYDSSLASQKQTLTQDYEQNASNLEQEQQKAQKQTDANLNRTYVEAEKAQKNYNEVQNAYGLTSGAMAQARLAQDNQLQADMTAIRAAQQETDAEVERQRSLLAKEYAAAIQQAQADNDLQRAQALYEAAQEEEERLLQQQKEAANMLGAAGDYSLLAQLYGLTPEQVKLLEGDIAAGGSGYGGGSGGSGGGGYGDGYNETPKAVDDSLIEQLYGAPGLLGWRNVTGGAGTAGTMPEKPKNSGGGGVKGTILQKRMT